MIMIIITIRERLQKFKKNLKPDERGIPKSRMPKVGGAGKLWNLDVEANDCFDCFDYFDYFDDDFDDGDDYSDVDVDDDDDN